MGWAGEVDLIAEVAAQNEIGEWVLAESRITVFCDERSVGRQEFYAASVQGLRPSVILTIRRYEYNDQRIVEYKSTRYKVLKTYAKNSEEVELTCERTATNGPATSRLVDTELVKGLAQLVEDILASEDVEMDEETRENFACQLQALLTRWST